MKTICITDHAIDPTVKDEGCSTTVALIVMSLIYHYYPHGERRRAQIFLDRPSLLCLLSSSSI